MIFRIVAVHHEDDFWQVSNRKAYRLPSSSATRNQKCRLSLADACDQYGKIIKSPTQRRMKSIKKALEDPLGGTNHNGSPRPRIGKSQQRRKLNNLSSTNTTSQPPPPPPPLQRSVHRIATTA